MTTMKKPKRQKFLSICLTYLFLILTAKLVVANSGDFIDSGQLLGNYNSLEVALGDLDGDGDLDAFVANWGDPAPNEVWLNNGAGYFTDSGQSLSSWYSEGLALGDLDGDGDLDAFVANGGYEPNKVWLNNGAGYFTDSGQSLGNLISAGVALGDLDGDGDLDAFVANWGDPAPNEVWLNNGAGYFTDSGQSLGDTASNAVALGDLDGDGDLDAFVANEGNPNTVWLNDGTGYFTDSGQSLGSSFSRDVALGDLDGDGDLDAFVANGHVTPPNKVWLNNGAGYFTDSGQSLESLCSRGLALGDLDIDGDLDAFVANYGAPNKVWLNDGTGYFTDSGQSLGSSYSRDVALGDLDGDGYLDAFVANSDANKVWLREGIPVPDDEGPITSDVVLDPYLVAVETDTYLSACVDDSASGQSAILSAEYSIDGGSFVGMSAHDGAYDEVSEEVGAVVPGFPIAGVHDVCVRGIDSSENVGPEECIFLVVYDPEGGFVIGGGWIWSPEEAYADDPSLTGKATFGFVSKYKKGAEVPSGETEFQFRVADLNFHSTSYDWLVVAGAKANYKGVGTVNGEGEYEFMLTAIDADLNESDSFEVDRFRIKIWYEVDETEYVVYDNALGDDSEEATTEIGGGSIVIHEGKEK